MTGIQRTLEDVKGSASMTWKSDTRYMELRIREVEPGDNGWGLYFDGGLVITCTSGTCQQAPTVGESARIYGKGFGYAVRGIVVEGRVYRYLTEGEQHQQEQAVQEAAAAKPRAVIADDNRARAVFRMQESARADYERGLANNTDPSGRRIYLFAADWAALMDAEIAAGRSIADVAETAGLVANRSHRVTGFQYGEAVSLLSQCWEYGEDLRRWHNLESQVGTEGERANESGGVLNPALPKVAAVTVA